MPQIKKKGTSGQAKNYITRTQAVRKLQISLPDFRRLCIFKGIYPREPRNKKKASKTSTPATTFYYTKDIQYLLHEPLLQKFRDHKALSKKISRALGRGEVGDAARLEKTQTPRMTLDHVIKERYPTFVDALRDLDDALSMLFLFANLPSTAAVPPKTIERCQRLCLEFEHYLIISHSLRKSFLSIKGIYYQATIQGQDILWLVPYKFVQRITNDVDFRIMGTFIEFYTTLLGFVNFRLYTSVGLVYPPKFNAASDEQGGELGAFTLEGRNVGLGTQQIGAEKAPAQIANGSTAEPAPEVQAKVDRIAKVSEPEGEDALTTTQEGEEVSDKIDTFEAAAPDADVLPQPQFSSNEAATLFAPYTIYLGRETPRAPLEFLLRSFGCKRIGWDAVLGDGAFTNNEADTSITHQIVDRPALPADALPAVPEAKEGEAQPRVRPGTRVPGRTYIQPQWVWDCINAGKLLRPDLYAPGATLPPHLSPWVQQKKGQYDPTAPLAEQEREGEAEEAEEESDVEGEEEAGDAKAADNAEEDEGSDEEMNDIDAADGMRVAGSSDEEESDEEDAANEEWDGVDEPEEEDSDEEDEAEKARKQHQAELEAEASGLPYNANSQNGKKAGKKQPSEAKKRATKKRREEEEELERQKMMMSRKKRKVLEKMVYSNRKRDEEAEKLRSKRRKIEKDAAAKKANKSA